MITWNILDKEKPLARGWYPVLVCWSMREGVSADADYWDGEKFISDLPISHFIDQCYNNKGRALSVAEKENPDW